MASTKPKTPRQHFRRKHPDLYRQLEELTTHLPPTIEITLEDGLIRTYRQLQSCSVYQSYDYTEQNARDLIKYIVEQQQYCAFLDLLKRAKNHHVRVCRHHVVEGATLTIPKKLHLPPELHHLKRGEPLFFSRDSVEDTDALRQLLAALEQSSSTPHPTS